MNIIIDIMNIILEYYDITEIRTYNKLYELLEWGYNEKEIKYIWNILRKNSIKQYYIFPFCINEEEKEYYHASFYLTNNKLDSIDDIPNVCIYNVTKELHLFKEDKINVPKCKDRQFYVDLFFKYVYIHPNILIPDKGICCQWFKNNKLYREKGPKFLIQGNNGEIISELWTEAPSIIDELYIKILKVISKDLYKEYYKKMYINENHNNIYKIIIKN